MRRVLRYLGPAATRAFDQLAFSPKPSRRLATVQYCDGRTAALRGRLRYRAGPAHTRRP